MCEKAAVMGSCNAHTCCLMRLGRKVEIDRRRRRRGRAGQVSVTLDGFSKEAAWRREERRKYYITISEAALAADHGWRAAAAAANFCCVLPTNKEPA